MQRQRRNENPPLTWERRVQTQHLFAPGVGQTAHLASPGRVLNNHHPLPSYRQTMIIILLTKICIGIHVIEVLSSSDSSFSVANALDHVLGGPSPVLSL